MNNEHHENANLKSGNEFCEIISRNGFHSAFLFVPSNLITRKLLWIIIAIFRTETPLSELVTSSQEHRSMGYASTYCLSERKKVLENPVTVYKETHGSMKQYLIGHTCPWQLYVQFSMKKLYADEVK